MSRLIVKNLSKKVTAEKLKETFSEKGEVTDVQLKYTKDGKFRNFAFVGFRTEQQAEAAKEYFHNTCIGSMKISVETCAALGDAKKPRAWSKYATDSTAFKKLHKVLVEEPMVQEKTTKKKIDKLKELLEKHKNDPMFAEFIEVHVTEKTAWIRDALRSAQKSEDSRVEDQDPNQDQDLATEISDQQETEQKEQEKIANKEISDLEYMKAVMKKKTTDPEKKSDSEKKSEDSEVKEKKIRNRPLFHVKVTGLPFKCKKRDVKELFRPLVPYSLRFPLGKGKKIAGFCFVGFRTEPELKKALMKDKLFISGHRIHVQKHEDKSKQQAEEQEQQDKKKAKQNEQNEESIGESGRIFVRNLPYVVTEEELTKLFEKYGPLTELSMPVDRILRQPKGFATVTFMIPEHAVRAYSELDGSVFCGRMLHLLPGKAAKDNDVDEEGLSFKEKKEKKLKSQAKSSHNWNTLFLGADAVADVIAENYGTSKQQLLTDTNKNTSAAVRLALGETQLVSETRNFLEQNGVFLDSFNQVSKKRSKTCILVKNLPAQTKPGEIRSIFEKFGPIARFVMPKHSITALIEFVEPSEARNSFTKLAYSQFKASPLYLEWAPENVFVKPAKVESAEEKDSNKISEIPNVDAKDDVSEETKEIKNEKDGATENKLEERVKDDVAPENDTTLFVKNLNFKTTEDSLREHFKGCGDLCSVTVAKKKDTKNPGEYLSMGYGFVQFYKKKHTDRALKELQSSTLDGKTLELKRSERGNSGIVAKPAKRSSKVGEQNGTKILVRNIPFQANRNELHEIFRAFGEIKTLRLPKRLTQGSEQHRGFCFVDFYSKADAKSAFDALCHSTHLYGRRLVLEWADASEDDDVESIRKRTASAFSTGAGAKKSKKAVVDVDNFVQVKE